MAAASRSRTPVLKDLDDLQKLVKDNIKQEKDPVVHPGLWRRRDMDCVVENYQELLAAISEKGQLLARSELRIVLRRQFAGDPALIKEFAEVIVGALKYCKAKSRMIRSGSKTSGPVLRIARLWAKQGSSQTLGATEEAANSDSEVEEVSTSNEQRSRRGARCAESTCWMPSNMFAGGSSMKTLKRHASVCSVASSEGELFGEAAHPSEPSTTKQQRPASSKGQQLQRPASRQQSGRCFFLKYQKRNMSDTLIH